MSRWIKIYDREARQLVTKEEYDRRRALRAKPCNFELPQKFERGQWRYIKATRTFEPIERARKLEVAAPFVQTDEIPETESYATPEGLKFTSKKKLLQHYKDNGMVVREKGIAPRPPGPYKPSIEEIRATAAKAINDIRWGNVPMSEKERECNLREQRALEQYKKRMH